MGTIEVRAAAGSCEVSVSGDQIGIPHGKGSRGYRTLLDGGWSVSGEARGDGPEAVPRRCTASVVEVDPSEPELRLRCTSLGEECQAQLLSSALDCGEDCGALECEAGYREKIPVGGCCPTSCVEDEFADPCSRATCVTEPTECEENFVLDTSGCCARCLALEVPELCAEGRPQWQRVFEQALADASQCDADADCGVVNAGNACELNCNLALNNEQISDFMRVSSEASATACQHCAPPSAAACGRTPQAICDEGRCTTVPLEDTCAMGRVVWDQIIDDALAAATACARDDDCVPVTTGSACGIRCNLPLNHQLAAGFIEAVNADSAMLCRDCLSGSSEQCDVPAPLRCVAGHCSD